MREFGATRRSLLLQMALTANTVAWRGRLSDHDTRWDAISASVDCRTPAERGEPAAGGSAEPAWMALPGAANAAGGGRRRIPKSRYSSIDAYISAGPATKDAYNDIPLVYDEAAADKLIAAGVQGTAVYFHVLLSSFSKMWRASQSD
jgi:glutamate--cysteine ligase catalytic subunit